MDAPDRLELRQTFNQAAERYDRARPTYPPALFDDLARLAGIGPGCRVLEIGCGTGQATVPLAERVRVGSAVGSGAGASSEQQGNERYQARFHGDLPLHG